MILLIRKALLENERVDEGEGYVFFSVIFEL